MLTTAPSPLLHNKAMPTKATAMHAIVFDDIFDDNKVIRTAHDNEELKILYKEFLKQPLSEKSLELLHTSYSDKSNLLSDK